MKFSIRNISATGLMIALGLLLPSLFHMFGAGNVMLPMHIPVLICGLACGLPYGAVCGFLLPYISSVLTGMPPLFPVATAMSLELCAYGALTGYFFRKLNWSIYASMIAAMLGGRLVSGAANAVLLGFAGREYGLTAFFTASFVTGLPGILVQLVFIPPIVIMLIKARLIGRLDAPDKSEA